MTSGGTGSSPGGPSGLGQYRGLLSIAAGVTFLLCVSGLVAVLFFGITLKELLTLLDPSPDDQAVSNRDLTLTEEATEEARLTQTARALTQQSVPTKAMPTSTPTITVVSSSPTFTATPTATPTPTSTNSPTPLPTDTPLPTIPPPPTAIPNTQPGSVLGLQETWVQEGLELTLNDYTVDGDKLIWHFIVRNNTGTDLLVDLRVSDITMSDNLGANYGPPCTDLDSISGRLCHDWSQSLKSGGMDRVFVSYHRTNFIANTQASGFTLHIARMSRITDAQWFLQIR